MRKNYRRTLTLFCCLFIGAYAADAQSKLKEKDLIGHWKLIIDIEEELEEAELELEEEDNVIGKIVLSSVSGLVTGILDEVEIYMEFLPKGELKILVEAFGEKEIEYSSWKIDDEGRLFIDDTDSYTSDRDFWLLQDGVLVASEHDNGHPDHNVYMVNLD